MLFVLAKFDIRVFITFVFASIILLLLIESGYGLAVYAWLYNLCLSQIGE